MPIVITGQCDPVIQPRSWTYDKDGEGWREIWTWIGTLQGILGLIPTIQSQFAYFNITQVDRAVHQLTASQNKLTDSSEEIEVRWELNATEDIKPIWETDQADALTKFDEIKKAVETKEAIPDSVQLSGNDVVFYNLAKKGVDGIVVFTPIIRKSYTASREYGTKIEHTNVGKILSKEQLTSLEGAPSDLVFKVPDLAGTRPTKEGTETTKFTYGWMKQFPDSTRTGFGKYSHAIEYKYGFWPNFFYKLAT